jgi:single-strand DNA-binding protein
MYHKVIIIGNLGNDPELRYTPTGDPVVTFSVAANRRWTNQDGSPGEETVWFRCTAWRRLAETINQYLSKGRQVYIEGRLTPDKNTGGPRIWVGQDGQARASYEVTVETAKFLGARGEAVEPPGDEAGSISSIEAGDLPFETS